MTNEQIVSEIRNGYSVTDYMQLLYESNLPLIKKFIKPYAAYEPMEDLLQESYFGLWEAVQHYETSANVRFMTYAEYWIRQSVQRYLEKCGSTVRIPSHTRQRNSSAFGHQTLSDIIPQDKRLWNRAAQVMKRWEGNPPDYLHLYQ